MADIVLATVNARYAHTSLGLRCLRANLGAWRERSQIVELTLEERPADMAERLLRLSPRILGLGVYIWNARVTAELLGILRRVRPDLTIVLGGPEVSYDPSAIDMVAACDYVITGEGEVSFADLVERLDGGAADASSRPQDKVIAGVPPDLECVPLPYSELNDTDLAQRTIYVEASRGCVFGCEFCLSSIERRVRRLPLERFLPAIDELWQRGLRRFRFVDRTFNLNPATSQAILDFFAARVCPELFVHVEVVPEGLPASLLAAMVRFPSGALQLEVGVQSLNDEVTARIGRSQQAARALAALTSLRTETRAHLHVDLIVGLPGEGLESIAASFDGLYATRPHEIQVGILKRLRGAAIARHDAAWQMVYAAEPPYELLQNACLDFALMQRLKRLARYWDLVGNSGRFLHATVALCAGPSAFAAFLAFADWLFAQTGRTHQIALDRLAALVAAYLIEQRAMAAAEAQALVEADCPPHASRRRQSGFGSSAFALPTRQARHHE